MKKGGEKQGHKWFARIGQSGAYKYFYSKAELAAYKAHQAGGAVKKAAGNINKEAHKAYWKGFNKLDKNKDGSLTPFKKTIRPEDDPNKNGQNAKKAGSRETGLEHEYKAHWIGKNKKIYENNSEWQALIAKKERKERKQAEVKEKLNKIAAGYDKKKDIENKNKGKFDSTKEERSKKAKQIRNERLNRFINEKHDRLGIIPATTRGPLGGKRPTNVYKDRIGTNGYEPAKNSTKIKKSNRDQSSLATQQEQERFNTEMMQESERLNQELIQEQQQQQQMIDNNMMNMMLFSKNNRKRLKYKNSSKA